MNPDKARMDLVDCWKRFGAHPKDVRPMPLARGVASDLVYK